MQTFKSTDVTNVTLLSLEEAKKLPQEILACERWWWLRSPGDYDDYAAIVYGGGFVYEYGFSVDYDYNAVRPAFLIKNLKSSNLKIGDMIEVAGIESFVISDNMALAKEPVGYTAFRKDYEAYDANNYEASDIKKWLEEWWQEKRATDIAPRLEGIVINALEWAIEAGEQATHDLIRAMGITSGELESIGYDAENFPSMHQSVKANS